MYKPFVLKHGKFTGESDTLVRSRIIVFLLMFTAENNRQPYILPLFSAVLFTLAQQLQTICTGSALPPMSSFTDT